MAATIPPGPPTVAHGGPGHRLTATELPPHPPAPWPAPRVEPPPPAAWYGDPWRVAALRWWDGRAWTAHVAYPLAGPAPAPAPPLPVLPASAGVAVLLVLFVSLLFGHAVTPAVVRAGWPLLAILGLQALLVYGPVLWLSVAVARRYGGPDEGLRAALSFRFAWADLGWGALTWLTIVVGNVVLHLVLRSAGIPFTSNVRGTGNGALPRQLLLAMTLVAVVAAPLVEEIVFRGIVLRAARSVLPVPVAIVVQGLCFGLAHVQTSFGAGNVGLVLLLSWAGICLGFVAHHFRRLGPSICAHAAVNGVVFLVLWLAPGIVSRGG